MSGPGGARAQGLPTTPSAWNIANALTVFRILLVPVFGWLLLTHDGADAAYRWAAFACFTVAMLTDRLDGDLARKHGLVTDFGKVTDPIADKALVSMALVGLSLIAEIPWWVTGLVLLREWGVTAVRFFVIRHGVMAAGRGGKLKTMLQALALGLFIMPRFAMPLTGLLDVVAWVILLVAVLVTVVTGIDYVVQAFWLRETSERTATKRALRALRRGQPPRP
jgi:CDP-diacylglycerol--glycerol-3-phosphate 3-phosphatidyltransferase